MLSNISCDGSTFITSQNDTRFLPEYGRTVSNIFYPTILAIGVVGNVMVITVILKIKEMRNSTNIFLTNLAISDLLVLLIWGVVEISDANSNQGILVDDERTCNQLLFILEIMPNASALTILAIGFERYYAVCEPLRAGYVCTRNRAYKICILAWLLAVLFCSPHLLMKYQIAHCSDGTYVETICKEPTDSFWPKAYHITNSSLFCFLPILILTLLYLVISRHFKRSVAQNVNIAAIKHRHRVVRMLATVIMAFFICHLPIRVFILFYHFASTDLVAWMGIKEYNDLWFFIKTMLYFHSIINPILYNLMSKRFRAGFKSICCGVRCDSGRLSRENTNI